jgi:hypothetical protein
MIKIMLTVRNRLQITKMCITALVKHSELPAQIYVYENLTDYKLEEHYAFWYRLYEKGVISQVTFATKESTFSSFSKAVSNNLFGLQHQQDPNKNKYDYLVLLDNDIIVTPGWDSLLKQAWEDVFKNALSDVLVVSQIPGGIKDKKDIKPEIAGVKAVIGKNGGSGLWSVRNDFFEKVGFLDVKRLVGYNKKHDQLYWNKLEKITNGRPYILGLNRKLGIHCGSLTYSTCNILTKNRTLNIDFKEKEDNTDKYLEGISFSEFYEAIVNDEELLKW